MILSIINFGWILITTFLLGYAVNRLILGKRIKYHIDLILVTGLMAATVYAETVSIFGPVSLWVSIGLGVIAAGIFFLLRKEIVSFISDSVKQKRFPAYIAAVLVLGAGGGNFKFYSSGLRYRSVPCAGNQMDK